MGGPLSGRYRTRNRGPVDAANRLDMRRLQELGLAVPGEFRAGGIQWSSNCVVTSSIRIVVDLTSHNAAFAKLNFSVNDEAREQTIAINSDPCRFGGRRYYFRCPRTWGRVTALFCVGGVFASRQAHRLTYRSQSLDPVALVSRARDKAEARLFGEDGHPMPRGANRQRLAERWSELEAEANNLMDQRLARVMLKWGILADDSLLG